MAWTSKLRLTLDLDLKQLEEIEALCSAFWAGSLSAEDFGQSMKTYTVTMSKQLRKSWADNERLRISRDHLMGELDAARKKIERL